MRVVFDCNVLVSAARTGGVCGRVIVEAISHHETVLSYAIVDEYEMVAGHPNSRIDECFGSVIHLCNPRTILSL